MTNHWNDIQNSDCIFIIGSNAAVNHPISFKYVVKAKEENDATLIVVDPRNTRTAALSDIYAPIRSGTDIAFIGGMIKWVLDDIEVNPDLYNMTYITEYTNAAVLVNPDLQTAAELDGKFSGFTAGSNPEFGKYDRESWSFQTDSDGILLRDPTLKDPDCVFQLMKRQYERYDVDTVSRVTGTPKETFLQVVETYARKTGPTGKSGTIMYAMGTTQHTHGTQNIRAYSILQLLLGNIGVAGGGINALRGESNVQGSTDHGMLFNSLPGYLKAPEAMDLTLADHNKRCTPVSYDPKSANWWQNYPKYMTSLLKSWYGENATVENDFGFGWLPKINPGSNYSHIALFETMLKGDIKGLFCWGQNPVVGSPNGHAVVEALKKLDWLVAIDLWDTETASFWDMPELNPSTIDTEVFLLPAAAFNEKEGSVINSGRWSQWRWKAVEPVGEARADLEIVTELMLEIIDLYEKEGGPVSEAITRLRWKGWYDDPVGKNGADSLVDLVSREINGFAEEQILNADGTVQYEKGDLLGSFAHLLPDGKTSSSNWLYTQSYNKKDGNRQKWRDNVDTHPAGIGTFSNWAWCWPLNRRIIYNRASVDLDGKPWDQEDYVISWNGETWDGDVPDGGWPPMSQEGTRYAFIMRQHGFAHLFGPGLVDGPFPEHYEPLESPASNLLSNTQVNPVVKLWRPDEIGTPDKYPIVCTTYRMTEHWQAVQMTRNLPWLGELMPKMFVQISEELAAEKGISGGDIVTVDSKRGSVECAAIITKRLTPLMVDGKAVHHIALPWHWGFKGQFTGQSANLLTSYVGDPNTHIPEFKAFLVDVRKGGLS